MRRPRSPQPFRELLRKLSQSPERLEKILVESRSIERPPDYPHWDRLRHLTPPSGLTHEEWWFFVRFQRESQLKLLPLRTVDGGFARYSIPDRAWKHVHDLDFRAGGSVELPEPIANPDTRDRYIASSVIEEAIRSSQLEGATTTRAIAKEMILSRREPRSKDERMILNNHHAMQFIREIRGQAVTVDLLLELHRILTTGTLDNRAHEGRFRGSEERIQIFDDEDQIVHVPPPAGELEKRVAALCRFANASDAEPFIPPLIRAIILHFWLAYDHPFVDGNGRTARALFYWCALRSGYWLLEFVSISSVLKKAPAQYGRAFLLTETDENDVTYFILHQLDVLASAVEALHAYVRRQSLEIRDVEQAVRGSGVLNHRQRALIGHALRHGHARYTIEGHQLSHGIVYQTARNDLRQLATLGLLRQSKIGRKHYFLPASDLERRLKTLR